MRYDRGNDTHIKYLGYLTLKEAGQIVKGDPKIEKVWHYITGRPNGQEE